MGIIVVYSVPYVYGYKLYHEISSTSDKIKVLL